MPTDLLHALASNAWTWFLIVLFFGGSIFVHELGHYLAARWRGAHVERFSIGFGPKIFSWRRGGTEYRISWLPLGGYVLLPQLADLGALEGGSTTDVSKLPSVSYGSKLIVFLAGAAFNILFALLLACVIWVVGERVSNDETTTRIGYVVPTIELPDHTTAPSPAALAHLQVGDRVVAVDGQKIHQWPDLVQMLVLGSGRGPDGQPQSVFTIERDGRTFNVTVHPRLLGEEKNRMVGIAAAYKVMAADVPAGSLGRKIGLRPEDQIVSLDATPLLNLATLDNYLASHADRTVTMHILRGGTALSLELPSRAGAKDPSDLGVDFLPGYHVVHPTPFAQVAYHIIWTFHTIGSLLNPHSDVGLSKLTGAIGIVRIFHAAAQTGLMAVIAFTIFINVNLAILNLLPFPVLDGGQILFATISKLRGRALPVNFVAAMTSLFLVLLVSMMIYVGFFDVRRWMRDRQDEGAVAPAAAAPARP